MLWNTKGNGPDVLGFIPTIIPGDDTAEVEIQAGYAHGGGYQPFDGFKQLDDGSILYPMDPPLPVLAEAMNSVGEIIRLHTYAWVSITQPDGTFVVTRMD